MWRLPFLAPEPGTVSDDMCRANPPVVLAAIRHQEGPLQKLTFSLELQGWGFMPGATVAIKSTANAQCSTTACLNACPKDCTGTPMVLGAGMPTVYCKTDCVVQLADNPVTYLGTTLMKVAFDPMKNALQSPNRDMTKMQGQAVDLLLLLSQPLVITVTNPDGASTVFTELGMSM